MSDLLVRHEAFFDDVTTRLKKGSWFKKGGWIAQSSRFPSTAKPEAVSYHVFKKHWFNEDRKGIHFETFRDLRPGKDTEVSLTLHTLHLPKIPGTNLKRDVLSKPLIDKIEKTLKAMKGYRFRAGKYGTQYFSVAFDAADPALAGKLANEIETLCTKLGPAIDETLEDVLAKAKR